MAKQLSPAKLTARITAITTANNGNNLNFTIPEYFNINVNDSAIEINKNKLSIKKPPKLLF